MAVRLTLQAAQRIKQFLQQRGKGIGVRLGVKTTGCSGLAYVLEFVDQIKEEEDQIFEEQGVTLIINRQNLKYLQGMSLDFVREGLNEGFKFDNPNSKGSCGCGESFHV